MKTKEQCATLAEYRRDVLRCPQSEIAHAARVKQGWISQIERGHLPAPWRREQIYKAYRLKEEELIRMVGNAAKMNAIRKPIAEDMPLFTGALNEAKQALQMQYEQKTGRRLA